MRTSSVADYAEDATDAGAGAQAIYDHLDGVHPDSKKPPEVGILLLELVRKIVKPGNARQTAQRFVSLVQALAPDVLALSQRKAAAQIGVTRAALSKCAIGLSEELRLGHSRWRKTEGARRAYAAAQHRAVARGRHASQVMRRKKTSKNTRGD